MAILTDSMSSSIQAIQPRFVFICVSYSIFPWVYPLFFFRFESPPPPNISNWKCVCRHLLRIFLSLYIRQPTIISFISVYSAIILFLHPFHGNTMYVFQLTSAIPYLLPQSSPHISTAALVPPNCYIISTVFPCYLF